MACEAGSCAKALYTDVEASTKQKTQSASDSSFAKEFLGMGTGFCLRFKTAVQRTKLKPNASTYGAIVDACVRNRDKGLALKTYRQALDAGLVDSQHIYTSSIAACIPDKDIHTALSIFHEMLR